MTNSYHGGTGQLTGQRPIDHKISQINLVPTFRVRPVRRRMTHSATYRSVTDQVISSAR